MEAGSVQTTSPLRFLYKPYKKVDMRRRKTFSDHAAVQRSEWKEKKTVFKKGKMGPEAGVRCKEWCIDS